MADGLIIVAIQCVHRSLPSKAMKEQATPERKDGSCFGPALYVDYSYSTVLGSIDLTGYVRTLVASLLELVYY